MKILKSTVLTVALFSVLVGGVQGQEALYLEQNISSTGMQSSEGINTFTKSWITDDMVRIEQPGQALLLYFTKQKIITMMLKEQEYVEMSFDDMDKILNLSKMFIPFEFGQIEFKKTGNQKTLNGWNVYEIEAKSEKQQFKIWLSTEIDFKREQLLKMYSKMPGLSVVAESFRKMIQFPGFPVLSDIDMTVMDMPFKTKIELLKIQKMSVADSLFEIPADFKQIENPLKSF